MMALSKIIELLKGTLDVNVTNEDLVVKGTIDTLSLVERACINGDVHPLVTPTYDGSGQGVHPSVLSFRQKWNGYHYWMAFTPYPNSNNTLENPSILASNDGVSWVVPGALVNPIALPESGKYLSDPELVYDNTNNVLYCYFREVQLSPYSQTIIRMQSTDGVTWGNKVECVFDIHISEQLSPAIVMLPDQTYTMWLGDGKYLYKYRSSNGTSWKYVFRCSSNFGAKGTIWHHSVRLTEAGYEFFVSTRDRNGGELFFGVSLDGLFIDFDERPLLTPQKNTFFSREAYRSCLVKDVETGETIAYISGRDTDGKWSIGYFKLIIARNSHRWERYNVFPLSDNITIPPASGSTPYQIRIYRSEEMMDIKKVSVGIRNLDLVEYRIFGSYVTSFSNTSLADFSVLDATSKSQNTVAVELDTPGILLYVENLSEKSGRLYLSVNFYR